MPPTHTCQGPFPQPHHVLPGDGPRVVSLGRDKDSWLEGAAAFEFGTGRAQSWDPGMRSVEPETVLRAAQCPVHVGT